MHPARPQPGCSRTPDSFWRGATDRHAFKHIYVYTFMYVWACEHLSARCINGTICKAARCFDVLQTNTSRLEDAHMPSRRRWRCFYSGAQNNIIIMTLDTPLKMNNVAHVAAVTASLDALSWAVACVCAHPIEWNLLRVGRTFISPFHSHVVIRHYINNVNFT